MGSSDRMSVVVNLSALLQVLRDRYGEVDAVTDPQWLPLQCDAV